MRQRRRNVARTVALLALLATLDGAGFAQTLYVSPDVPAEPDGSFLLPWQIVRHDPTSAAPFGAVLTVPGDPAITALHRMDRPGHWLFSVGAHTDLAGLIGIAEPRDVVHDSAGAFSRFFCGGMVLPGAGRVPAAASIDALYLDASIPGAGGDTGDLIVSFDGPTPLGGVGVIPGSALVRYVATGGGSCGDWQFAGIELDVAAVGGYFPGSSNVTGADRSGNGRWLLTLDIPSDLSPLAATAPPTFVPGQVVSYDPVAGDFDLFSDLQTSGSIGWQLNEQLDGLSCSGNPGALDPSAAQIRLNKVALSTDITVDWSPGGCSAGAENYGIYEGKLATVNGGAYDHAEIDCDDGGSDQVEQVSPSATDTYYLVVPHTTCSEEGSYGTSLVAGTAAERPVSTGARCASMQTLAICP